MALLILALLQRIFLMSSLMLLLVWLIFFMVLIKLLPILGTISGKTVKLMVLALICLGKIGRAVQQECRDRKSGSAGMPRPISYAVFCLKKKNEYPSVYQRQTCHPVQPNQATYHKRQKCQPATYLQQFLYQLYHWHQKRD